MTLRDYKVELDVAADCPLHHFLSWVDRWGAKILEFKVNGPGGGNPHVRFALRDEASLRGFLEDYAKGGKV